MLEWACSDGAPEVTLGLPLPHRRRSAPSPFSLFDALANLGFGDCVRVAAHLLCIGNYARDCGVGFLRELKGNPFRLRPANGTAPATVGGECLSMRHWVRPGKARGAVTRQSGDLPT